MNVDMLSVWLVPHVHTEVMSTGQAIAQDRSRLSLPPCHSPENHDLLPLACSSPVEVRGCAENQSHLYLLTGGPSMAADHDGSVKLASALLEPKRLKPSEALCAVTFDAQAYCTLTVWVCGLGGRHPGRKSCRHVPQQSLHVPGPSHDMMMAWSAVLLPSGSATPSAAASRATPSAAASPAAAASTFAAAPRPPGFSGRRWLRLLDWARALIALAGRMLVFQPFQCCLVLVG